MPLAAHRNNRDSGPPGKKDAAGASPSRERDLPFRSGDAKSSAGPGSDAAFNVLSRGNALA